MTRNNDKSSNKSNKSNKTLKINVSQIDNSFNFIKNIVDSTNSVLDNDNDNDNYNDNNDDNDDANKTIEQLINDMCDEFDKVLRISTNKKLSIDQSYNDLIVQDNNPSSFVKQSFSDNIKHNQNKYFIMNKKNDNGNKSVGKDKGNSNDKRNINDKENEKSISYYLNTYNYNYHKQRRRNLKKTLGNTLLDINHRYDTFQVKQYDFSNHTVEVPEPIKIVKKKIDIKVTLNSIEDLIQLTEDYPLSSTIEYNIDMEAIHKIKPDIVRLNDMIGMHNLKENILDQILYFIQKLHVHKDENTNNEFMHTVIYGPPGTGKTETAHIIGAIYSKLGILKNNVFKKVTRSDLIAGYLGQTAIKTTEVVKSAIGGVLFIDEAYALGNIEKKDSFAKECIDTLCEALSNHKHELMVIIAGYEEDLKKCFFAYNQGLDSRFIWRFKIDDYTPEELQMIFNKKVKECEWTIDDIPNSWFKKHKDYFKYSGRDMETLLSKVKIAHSRRVFCLSEDKKRKITIKDIKNGFKLYLKNEEVKSRVEKIHNPLVNMYM